jgi:hypothetical protein
MPRNKEQHHAYKRTTHGRAKVLFDNATQRCKDKNLEISIDYKWIEEHLKRGTCELTNIPFNLEPPPEGLTRRPDAPSLDRIDKHKHYTEDNTRVILWAVNCALSEYGTEVMLPILKAMIKGIEDAQAKSATPVPTTDYRQGEVYPELGSFSATWAGEDSDYAHHHCGADARQDAYSSTQESSGDSMGHGDSEVGTPISFESFKDYGLTKEQVRRIIEDLRHIPDKP